MRNSFSDSVINFTFYCVSNYDYGSKNRIFCVPIRLWELGFWRWQWQLTFTGIWRSLAWQIGTISTLKRVGVGFFLKFGICLPRYTTSHPGRQPFIVFPSMCKHVRMYASHTRSNSIINLSDIISRGKGRIDKRVCSFVVFVWSWSQAVKEKRGLRMSENKMPWRMFVT